MRSKPGEDLRHCVKIGQRIQIAIPGFREDLAEIVGVVTDLDDTCVRIDDRWYLLRMVHWWKLLGNTTRIGRGA